MSFLFRVFDHDDLVVVVGLLLSLFFFFFLWRDHLLFEKAVFVQIDHFQLRQIPVKLNESFLLLFVDDLSGFGVLVLVEFAMSVTEFVSFHFRLFIPVLDRLPDFLLFFC